MNTFEFQFRWGGKRSAFGVDVNAPTIDEAVCQTNRFFNSDATVSPVNHPDTERLWINVAAPVISGDIASIYGPLGDPRRRNYTVARWRKLVEWNGGAAGFDQWLPVCRPFRASWQIPIRTRDSSCPRFPHPLCSSRTASFPRYGWRPAWSLRALPQPSRAAFDAEPTFLSVSGSESRCIGSRLYPQARVLNLRWEVHSAFEPAADGGAET